MTFHVGQKVVCVDADAVGKYCSWPSIGGLDGLRHGAIYTVRTIRPYRGVLCLYLNEIIRPRTKYGEAGYAVQRFRPIVEKKTDISIFEEILRRETVDDHEEVLGGQHADADQLSKRMDHDWLSERIGPACTLFHGRH